MSMLVVLVASVPSFLVGLCFAQQYAFYLWLVEGKMVLPHQVYGLAWGVGVLVLWAFLQMLWGLP